MPDPAAPLTALLAHAVHPSCLSQLRCYRLLDFFSFLTYSLAYPLLFVTLLRNVLVRCSRSDRGRERRDKCAWSRGGEKRCLLAQRWAHNRLCATADDVLHCKL